MTTDLFRKENKKRNQSHIPTGSAISKPTTGKHTNFPSNSEIKPYTSIEEAGEDGELSSGKGFGKRSASKLSVAIDIESPSIRRFPVPTTRDTTKSCPLV